MCSIYMDTFTWQVVATFFAAACALFVGWRQVGIAKGQKTIAEAQSKTSQAAIKVAEAQALTARLAQRANLFDRRLKVYNTVLDYLKTGLDGKPLDLFDLDGEVKQALIAARFLFPAPVNKVVLDALELADECAQLTHDRRAESIQVNAAILRNIRHQLRSAFGEITKVMGDEMVLYAEPVASSKNQAPD